MNPLRLCHRDPVLHAVLNDLGGYAGSLLKVSDKIFAPRDIHSSNRRSYNN